LGRFRDYLPILTETPEIQGQWEQLVSRHEVCGKKAHDARLVALMLVHGVDRILTFNVGDFRRFGEIRAIHPAEVTQAAY
jgi:predicted nucleic acid-binding protein